MKSNWLTFVAITASLIAGFVCSTAFADNKGMKFGGNFNGGNLRSFSGGNGPQMRNFQNLGGLQNQIKNHNLQSQGISGHNLGIGSQINKKPQIQVRPGTQILNGIGQHNGQGNSGIGGIKIGNGGIKIGTGGSNQGGLGITLGNGGLKTTIGHVHGNGNKQCHVAPKCIDPCFSKGCSPGGFKCSPCLKNWTPYCTPWWWTCCTHYCNQPIYYPVCTRPIVIQVPVYVEVPVVQEQLVQVPVGSTITMQALGLGHVPGRLILVVDKASFESQIAQWNDAAVTATLPMFSLAAPTFAELVIVRADGQPATSMKVELIPAQPAVAAAVQQAQAVQPVGGELSAAAALAQ